MKKSSQAKDGRDKPGDLYQKRSRWATRLLPLILGNVLIWGLAYLVLQRIPLRYTSEGAITVSGVGSQGKVLLPNAGQALSGEGNDSPYQYLSTVDPRENYKHIALSEVVLKSAATSAEMSLEEFGEPELQSTEGTTIVEFKIGGSSPAEAQSKARSFYQALTARVKYLRQEEVRQQKLGTRASAETAQRDLQQAKQRLYEFNLQSPLKVVNQINQLSEQLEKLRIQRVNVVSEQRAITSQIQQSSENLSLSPQDATDALVLSDDQVFQKYLQSYSDATVLLQSLSATLTTSNPQVIEQKETRDESWAALQQRSQVLLNRPASSQLLSRLSLRSEGGRQELAADLLNQQAKQQSLGAQARELEQQIEGLSARLQTLSQERLIFDRLQQNAKLSESIFLSKFAQLNVDKPDYATSYPPIQLVAEPSLPEEHDSAPGRTLMLGVLALSFIGTTGMVTLWWNRSEDRDQGGTFFEEQVPDRFHDDFLTASLQAEEPSISHLSAPAPRTMASSLHLGANSNSHNHQVSQPQLIETLSLRELQEITDGLHQSWSYAKGFFEEQEEELRSQYRVISTLQEELSSASLKEFTHEEAVYIDRLKAVLSEEVERKQMLEESLEGQRSHLKEQHETLLRHQRVLQERLQQKAQAPEFPSVAS